MAFATIGGSSLPLAAQPAAPAHAQDAYYARYTTPGMCKRAAQRMTRFYWRDRRADTVVYAPAAERVPPLTAQTARACAARFTVATVKERELIDLARLYLLGGQDSLAQLAVDRVLAAGAAQPARARGWTLLHVVRTFLTARPTRLVQAQRYLAELDALGPTAGLWRLLAHTELATYAMGTATLPTAVAEAEAAIAASRQIPSREQVDWVGAIESPYYMLAEATSYQGGGPAALAVLDRAVVELTPLQRGLQDLEPPVRPGQGPPHDGLLWAINGRRGPYAMMGQPAPPLHAEFRYRHGGPSSSSDTLARPRAGEVTLLVFFAENCRLDGCYPGYATLKRLHAKYAARGVRIVLHRATAGYFRTQLAAEPATEAELWRSYTFDYLKLPGLLQLEGRTYTFRPPPDGRREYGPSPNAGRYGGRTVLTDHQGRIRRPVDLDPKAERLLDAEIAAALTAAER